MNTPRTALAGANNGEQAMKKFTIEMTFDLPCYRQHTYEAETLEQAIEMAKADDDWHDLKKDYDCCNPERITGAWEGEEAYCGPDLTGSFVVRSEG